MKKLPLEEMKNRIRNKGYYLWNINEGYEEEPVYELCHGTGNKPGVKLTNERAQEWIDAGIEVLN